MEDRENFGPLAEDYRQRYVLRDPDIDIQFGINFLRDGKTIICNTPMTIDRDHIIIGPNVYDGTEGLWTLLTEKKRNSWKIIMIKTMWKNTWKY